MTLITQIKLFFRENIDKAFTAKEIHEAVGGNKKTVARSIHDLEKRRDIVRTKKTVKVGKKHTLTWKFNNNPKPTRILQEPYWMKTNRGQELQLLCDDGLIYNIQTAAATIPITPSSLSNRIKREGWQSKNLFRRSKDLPETTSQQSPYKDYAPGDLAYLNEPKYNKPRTYNLKKIT